jgi:predicted nucleic acid-binding protein
MILDAGALIAVSRNDRVMIARLIAAHEEGDDLTTHPMVVAQVWRDQRRRQAPLARLLRGVEIIPIDDNLGRRCGELLGKAKTADPVDAAVVLIATDGESVVTSDPDDILHLARFATRRILVIRCQEWSTRHRARAAAVGSSCDHIGDQRRWRAQRATQPPARTRSPS